MIYLYTRYLYHIAEADSNLITRCTFMFADGFTFVVAYLALGLHTNPFDEAITTPVEVSKVALEFFERKPLA